MILKKYLGLADLNQLSITQIKPNLFIFRKVDRVHIVTMNVVNNPVTIVILDNA